MNLIIDIPEETYNEVKWRGLFLCPRDENALVNSIKNGVPYPRGEWIYIGISETTGLKIVKCTRCKKRQYGSTDFCSNCGAAMRKKVGEKDGKHQG